MLIRSQDRKDIVNLDKTYRLGIVENPIIKTSSWFVYAENQFCIGVYSTEAKATKVLDLISAEYQNSSYWDYIFNQSANVQIPYAMNSNRVFQMPKDEDVIV